jgi:hypothetical protein
MIVRGGNNPNKPSPLFKAYMIEALVKMKSHVWEKEDEEGNRNQIRAIKSWQWDDNHQYRGETIVVQIRALYTPLELKQTYVETEQDWITELAFISMSDKGYQITGRSDIAAVFSITLARYFKSTQLRLYVSRLAYLQLKENYDGALYTMELHEQITQYLMNDEVMRAICEYTIPLPKHTVKYGQFSSDKTEVTISTIN